MENFVCQDSQLVLNLFGNPQPVQTDELVDTVTAVTGRLAAQYARSRRRVKRLTARQSLSYMEEQVDAILQGGPKNGPPNLFL